MTQIFTPKEVADHFRLTETYVKRMAREGEWPHWRPTPRSRQVRFTEENLASIEASIQISTFSHLTGRKTK